MTHSVKSLRDKLLKKWKRYDFHREWLAGTLLFPQRLTLPKITGRELLHRFSELQVELMRLQADLASLNGVRLIERESHFSTMGRQRLPDAVEFETAEALFRFIGAWRQWQNFTSDVALIGTAFPELKPWLEQIIALIDANHGIWPLLLKVCRYFIAHPRPMVYLRQLDIVGIDSKFIESHKKILRILFDQLLAQETIDMNFTTLNSYGFEQRFGLLYEKPLVRFRLLDPLLSKEFGGLSDITTPVEEFSKLNLILDNVVITENKVNFLAFPVLRNSLIIFGLGYGVQRLKQVPWLKDVQIYYWGDIDTNGLAILSQLRVYFPHAQSLLMDEATLLQCREWWGEEPENNVHPAGELAWLHDQELELYKNLKSHAWQPRLRLEQERIPFHLLEQALAERNLK
ncbi:Wadjet anti-phage system protein JetD domain-containing protein [Dryocola clanedunensis]|uniref:Wadjet anti-phage system protein JetD domain-containing protein n=1 Tax=Cedecea sulfonylureivorans TaxID=3051154 RepID=UPI001926636F|nr:DUF3322 and DUF2220 domain-containing protein [Cedecea sulfonylureivorans]